MMRQLVLGSVWGRKGRMIAAGVALVVPAALVSGAANFLLDAEAKLRSEVKSGGPNLVVRGNSVPVESLGRFRSWRHAERLEEEVGRIPVVRVHPDRAAQVWTWWRVEGAWPRTGEALAGRRLARRLRLRPGATVSLEGRDVPVSGILENEEAEERALVLADPPARFTRVDFVLDGDVEGAAAEIARDVPGVTAEPVRALTAAQGALARKLRGIFGFVLALLLAIAGLGIAATFTALVQEQRREIGLAAALGARPAQIARFLAAQGAVLLGVALVVGALAGAGLSDLLGRRVFGAGTSIRPAAFALASGACALAAALGLVVPVRRALAVEPAVVLREE